MEINDFSDGWKYFSLPMPAHQWREVSVEIRFFDNIGNLYIDGLQLSKNDVSTKRYDNNGNITGVCVSERESTYTYDGYNRIKTMTTPGGVKQTYTYDNKTNNLKSVTADYGPSSYMKYDAYGNQKSLSVHKANTTDENGNKSTELELYSENEYTTGGNYLKSSIDNNGIKTTFEYNEIKGLPTSEVHPGYQAKIEDDRIPKKTGVMGLLSAAAEAVSGDKEAGENVTYEYGYDKLDRVSSVTRKSGKSSRSIVYNYGDFSDLKSIHHNKFDYGYTYDAFGNLISTSIAGDVVQTNTYNSNNGSLMSTTYADGKKLYKTYDAYGNISAIKNEKDETTDSFEYYNDGQLSLHRDRTVGINTEYEYNDHGRVSRSKTYSEKSETGHKECDEYSSRLQYIYNPMGRVEELNYEETVDDEKYLKSYKYTFYKDGNNNKNTLPDKSYKEFKYDSLRRTNGTVYTPSAKYSDTPSKKLYTQITYEGATKHSANCKGTTNKVSMYQNKVGRDAKASQGTYEYSYDNQGNISKIKTTSSLKASNDKTPVLGDRAYAYNAFGEVTSALENYTNGDVRLYSYDYDGGGNITTEKVKVIAGEDIDGKEEATHTYTYGDKWNDKLTYYHDGKTGYEITYDQCGNPLKYLGYDMEWDTVNGSLTSIKKDSDEFKYTYFSDGQRLSKNVNGKKTTYIYNAGMLLAEETDTDRINYYYDADGLIVEIGYQKKENGKFGAETYYFFTRNGQGDIVGIYRCCDATLVGSYEYDLWGNIVSVKENVFTDTKSQKEITDTDGILNRNPLRYRGYYYDTETGFYYLNARYYDPKVHRFISADTVIAGVSGDTNGYNLFAYCNNDPVNKMDATGQWPQLTNKQKVAIGLAVIAVAAVLTVATAGAGGPLLAAAHCFAMGALEGSIMGAASGAVSGAAISGGIAFVTSGGNLEKTKQAAIDGACDGFMTGSITGFVTGGMNSPHCFVAGTLVESINGPIPIEHIEEGMLVLAKDPYTGDITYKEVTATYINETDEILYLNVDGEEIRTTSIHPFYVKGEGFVLAGKLEEGAVLIDNEGKELHLLVKRWEQLQAPVPVYNFTVDDYHTYFVGKSKVFVHNSDCGVGEVYKKGSNAEKTLKELTDGGHKYFATTDDIGARIVDSFGPDNIAYEAKEGYTACTAFVRKQIAKDAYLIKEKKISGACWNFFKSPITGKIGASKKLLETLEKYGIEYIIWN